MKKEKLNSVNRVNESFRESMVKKVMNVFCQGVNSKSKQLTMYVTFISITYDHNM